MVPSSTVAGLSPLIVMTGGTLSLYPSSVIESIATRPATANKAVCIKLNSASAALILAAIPAFAAPPALAAPPVVSA